MISTKSMTDIEKAARNCEAAIGEDERLERYVTQSLDFASPFRCVLQLGMLFFESEIHSVQYRYDGRLCIQILGRLTLSLYNSAITPRSSSYLDSRSEKGLTTPGSKL